MPKTKTSWAKGQSGNPSGTAQSPLRAALAAHGPAVVDKIVQMAKAGDVQAARLVIDRLVPTYRPTAAPIAVTLPDGSLSDQARALVAAAAAGELSAEVATDLLAGLARVAGIDVADELRRRLDALEGRDDHGDLA